MKALFFASAASGVMLLVAGSAAAQAVATPTNAKADAGDTVAEVVVTAQRVSTSLQRTPISVQTYSGAELAARGVTDIGSLARTDASVNINLSTGMPIISIRGVSSQNATEVGDPAVSVATDGVFTNRPYGTFGALYDTERVEILRGPQGTLFGRNSTGGTINIITARPSDSKEAQFTGEVGNYNLFAAEGYANVPLSATLSARLSFDVRDHKGYRDNAPAKRGDDEDTKSGRLQLAWKPTDQFNAWVLGEYTKQGGVGSVAEIIPFTFLNGVSGEPVHAVAPTISDGHTFPILAPYVRDLSHWELRGGATYTLDNGISLNYLGGYDKIRYLRQQAINPDFGGFGNGPLPVPFIYRNLERPTTINQEIRIASPTSDRLSWQAGAYYFQESSSVFASTIFNPGSNIEAKGIDFNYPTIKSSSKAVYGQASFAITDNLKLTAGGRFTWDKKSRDGTFLIYPPQTGLPFTITIPQPASASSHKPTWTVGLDYQATSRNLIYGKVSTGYKVGGFNDATSVYGPEEVTSYEIGSKNTFLDGHLQLNLSGFRMDYKNQQVTQFVSGATSSGSMTVNAGRSRIWGAELNLVAQSLALGRLTVSGNYTHARYLDFISSAGWDGTLNLDLAGNRLPLSPTWSFSANYEHPFDVAGGTLTPRVGVKYQTRQYFSPNNYPSQSQGGYALVDLGLDYAPQSEDWILQLYVKNLANKTVFADASEFYTFNNYSYSYQPPRTFGARLTVKFR